MGAGDVIEIVVVGNPELSRLSTVHPSGNVNVPLLGEVAVAGRSLADIQQELKALLGRDYLVNPQVEVWVREYRSQFVTVLGEVNSPGRKTLRGRARLFDILVEAGGFTPRASGEIQITRLDGTFSGGEHAISMRFGGAGLNTLEQVNLEVLLRNGDVVTALPKSYVTVEGEVAQPGRYAITPDSTLTEVIASAGGLTRFGRTTVKIERLDPETHRSRDMKVSLKDIRKGKKPDVALQANDRIVVGRRLI